MAGKNINEMHKIEHIFPLNNHINEISASIKELKRIRIGFTYDSHITSLLELTPFRRWHACEGARELRVSFIKEVLINLP